MFFFNIKEELSLTYAYECVNIYATSVNVCVSMCSLTDSAVHTDRRKEIITTHFRFCFSVSPPSDGATERHSENWPEKKKRYLIKCLLSSTVFYINQEIPVHSNAASCRSSGGQKQFDMRELLLEKKKSSSIHCSQSFKLIVNQTRQLNVLSSHSRSICV